MKHSIMFEVKETGKTIVICSKCFDEEKELDVAILDNSTKGYHMIDIDILQQEESNRRH
jgi:hypothetical protein